MSSGLRFIATQDPDYTPDKGYPDHFYIYTGAVNAFDYSVNVPLQFPVNTEGRYRNADPLTIGRLIKRAVEARGEEYLTWPQRALFDRIGIRRQVLETDPYGNFLLTGYDYGTAAQLGTARPALPAGRGVAGRAAAAGGLGDVRQHPGAGVEARRPMAGCSGSTAPGNGTCPAIRTSWPAPAGSGRS